MCIERRKLFYTLNIAQMITNYSLIDAFAWVLIFYRFIGKLG